MVFKDSDVGNVEKTLAEMKEKKVLKKLVSTASISHPIVESVALTNSSEYRLGSGADIEVVVTMSEPVIVKQEGGKPTLKIQFTRDVTRDAKYEDGSGSKNLIFRYTVSEDLFDESQGISVPNGIIQVPHGSSIENSSGKSARLDHPAAAVPSPPLRVTYEFNEVKVNDVVSHLSRSDLRTLVVEGDHDRSIYEKIEHLFGDEPFVDTLPVGGRDNLLAIYERRSKFSSHVPVAFMADPDMWVLEDPHNMLQQYADIIWTVGYSLENDLYADGNPTSLIPSSAHGNYKTELDRAILDFVKKEVPGALRHQYYAIISANPALKLRGKDLLEVLGSFRSPKYDHLQVCKLIINTVRSHHPLLTRLILRIHNEITKATKKLPESRRKHLKSVGAHK